jgi:hypothetical protein
LLDNLGAMRFGANGFINRPQFQAQRGFFLRRCNRG